MRLLRRVTLVSLEQLRRCLAIVVALALVGSLKGGISNQTHIEVALLLRTVGDLAERVQ